MKLGSREKYQPIQYCWVHISRLLGYLVSYMPFAYRYPTNMLQHPDRTAFALAVLMLSCLRTLTIMCRKTTLIHYCSVLQAQLHIHTCSQPSPVIRIHMHPFVCGFNFGTYWAGDARTQSPPTKNYAPESPSLGDRRLQQDQVQCQVSTWRNRLLDHGIPCAR